MDFSSTRCSFTVTAKISGQSRGLRFPDRSDSELTHVHNKQHYYHQRADALEIKTNLTKATYGVIKTRMHNGCQMGICNTMFLTPSNDTLMNELKIFHTSINHPPRFHMRHQKHKRRPDRSKSLRPGLLRETIRLTSNREVLWVEVSWSLTDAHRSQRATH